MCAEIYHCADFITSDPVQFPHRYTLKQDIEISGLLTAIMSFGNRKQILKKADELHRLMGDSPYQYVHRLPPNSGTNHLPHIRRNEKSNLHLRY